jgi:hypothetical protein
MVAIEGYLQKGAQSYYTTAYCLIVVYGYPTLRNNRISKQEITQQDKRGLFKVYYFLMRREWRELRSCKNQNLRILTWYFNLQIV